MDDLLSKLLQNGEYDVLEWDGEFYVSISKASELSGLSESQIRYFDDLLAEGGGIRLGRREGPNARNRVYTKRDLRLLRWVYQCGQHARTAEIAQLLKEHQDEILASLNDITLPQMLKREKELAGHHLLIADLVTVLLAIWQERHVKNAVLQGVLLGPQQAEWKTAFLKSREVQGTLDLAHSLVIWSMDTFARELADTHIFFSHQSWYLPSSSELFYESYQFPDNNLPFAIVFVWKHTDSTSKPPRLRDASLDKPKALLADMLMDCLRRLLEQFALSSGEPLSIYSKVKPGSATISRGLSLLLEHCVKAYFPDCYSYIARLQKDDRWLILEQCGDTNVGYVAQYLDKGVLDVHKIPWWIKFAKERVSIALDKDAERRPDSINERGSVVCLPLVVQGQVKGVLGIENIHSDNALHCLASKGDIDGPARLRYLICMAEIAADYLSSEASSLERIERFLPAYRRYETIDWHWNIYQRGGVNYTDIINEVLDWIEEIHLTPTEDVYIAIVDVAEEDELARKHKGFDMVITLVQETLKRIHAAIKNDSVATDLYNQKHLLVFDTPIADHIVIAIVRAKLPYLHVFLERIRRFWSPPDGFMWEKEISVSMHVGLCKFAALGSLTKGEALELMKHHLWEMYHSMLASSERLYEYNAVVDVDTNKLGS